MPHTGFQPEQHGFTFVNAWPLEQKQVVELLLRALCARAMTGIGAARSRVPHIHCAERSVAGSCSRPHPRPSGHTFTQNIQPESRRLGSRVAEGA